MKNKITKSHEGHKNKIIRDLTVWVLLRLMENTVPVPVISSAHLGLSISGCNRHECISSSSLTSISPSPQHLLTAFGGIIAIPLILSQGLCLQHDSLTQGHLISTIFFVSGMCTLLQVTFGIRWVKLRLVGYGFGQIIQQQQSVCEHKWGQKQGEQGTRESHVYLVNKDWPW